MANGDEDIEEVLKKIAMAKLGSRFTHAWDKTRLFDDVMSPIARSLAWFLSTIKHDQARMEVCAATFQYIANEVREMCEARDRGERFAEIDFKHRGN